VQRGITKINLATQLNIAMTTAIRQVLRTRLEITDPRIYGKVARDAMTELVRTKCRVVGSSGRGVSFA
jgi:fructose/tagatose bisphosphate aldolase